MKGLTSGLGNSLPTMSRPTRRASTNSSDWRQHPESSANHAPLVNQGHAITERVMGWLPEPRMLWLAVWALTPVGLRTVLGAMTEESDSVSVLEIEVIGTAVSVYVVALSLWAARYLTEKSRQMESVVRGLSEPGRDIRWLAGVDSTSGPVVLAVLLTVLEDIGLLESLDAADLLVLALLQFVVHLPLAAGVWVVWTILVSMYRMGRFDLRLDPHSGDPTLGLKPIGRLAVLTFGIFSAGATPSLLANTDSGVALVINGSTFLIVVAVFVVALWGVHRQMMRLRDRAVSEARHRLQVISTRIADAPESRLNEGDATLLMASDTLERRAREIAVWPLTGGLYVRTGAILLGVLIGLITRAIGTALGV